MVRVWRGGIAKNVWTVDCTKRTRASNIRMEESARKESEITVSQKQSWEVIGIHESIHHQENER